MPIYGTTPDATTSSKGKVQLAGDLGGTAAAPTVLTMTGAAWASWTPTLSGLFNNSKWNKTCTYIQIGKTVFFRMLLVANTTTPMDGSGEPIFTLPVTAVSISSSIGLPIVQMGALLDANVPASAACFGEQIAGSTTTARFRYFDSAAAPTAFRAVITTTAPFTWTTNDTIQAQGFYEAA